MFTVDNLILIHPEWKDRHDLPHVFNYLGGTSVSTKGSIDTTLKLPRDQNILRTKV